MAPHLPQEFRQHLQAWRDFLEHHLGLSASTVATYQRHGVLYLRLVRAKSQHEDVTLPIEASAVVLLRGYLVRRGELKGDAALFPAQETGRPQADDTVRKIFHARRLGAGIRPRVRRMTPHILRHKSIVTTQQYLHRGPWRSALLLRNKNPLREKALGVLGRFERGVYALGEEKGRLRR